MSGWELPQSICLAGVEYAVNADYRDVLEVIRWLTSADEPEQVRVYVALHLFYDDWDSIPSEHQQEAVMQMMQFINGGMATDTDTGKPGPKLIDWEQDQRMIVAEINRVAGCEVRQLPFVHWWTFLGWFSCIGEGQLATVVSIRQKLRTGKKLESWEREYYQQHRAQVTLKKSYTAEERAEMDRLNQLLGE